MADTNGKATKEEVKETPAELVFKPGEVRPTATHVVGFEYGGQEHTLRLTLKAMKKIKDVANVDMWKGNPFVDLDPEKITIYMWACMLHENDKLTLEEVEGQLDFLNIPYYIDRLSMLYGISMPEPEEADPNVK